MSKRYRSPSTLPRRRLPTDLRFFFLVLSCAIPASLLLVGMSTGRAWSVTTQIAVAVLSLGWIAIVAFTVRGELLRHIRTLSNLVESIRTGDYSMKGARAREPGELAELYRQVNALTDSLKSSRQNEQELLSVLETVVSHIDVAIVVCDACDRIRLVNRQAVALLSSSTEKLVGMEFGATVLAQLPLASEPRLMDFCFPGGEGRWQVSQHQYRHHGRASRILFIADLQQVLSDQEIAAWQRLIRVIGHEVNNSLTPITSLCQTLTGILGRPDSMNYADDIRDSLRVIAERANALKEFIAIYARLARLPEPNRVVFPLADLVGRIRRIFAAEVLEIAAFPEIVLFGDPVHLEQALINLIKNGLEANPAHAPPIRLACHVEEGRCEFQISDRGPGISNPENLFVPFYTTKGEGAGIGLVLCRQIAAKHHGYVSLANRTDGPGAVAKLTLPLHPGNGVPAADA